MSFDVPYVTPPYCVQSADHVIDNIRAELSSFSETHSSYHLFIRTLFSSSSALVFTFFTVLKDLAGCAIFFFIFSPLFH